MSKKRKINELNRGYFEELPDNFRKATIKDFYVNGKRKEGMVYLIWSQVEKRYQEYKLSKHKKAKDLIYFIDAGRVFVPEEGKKTDY